MKTIKVLISASKEMHDEKIQFASLIENLNEALALKGVELERVKWDPASDGSVEDFMAEVKECEMCLTLHWQELAENAEEELAAAYHELKDGHNPQNLYIFFKEPCPEINQALTQFKQGIVSKYGHFFCKFENVDTMNLQFVMQLLKAQDQLQDKQDPFIVVSSGKVKAGDKELVDLDKIPFASLNKEYQRLKQESDELAKKLAEAKEKHRSDPDDEDIEELYFTLKRQYKDLTAEFNQYQNHLYDIALSFAKLDGERYSERIRRAKEEFEKGNVIAADEILNMEEMKREAEQEKLQYKQHEDNLRTKIEEFTMKAETVMGNTDYSVSDRYLQACDAYEQAIEIAKLIHYEDEELCNVLFKYSDLLGYYDQNEKASAILKEAIAICRTISERGDDKYLMMAMMMNNLSLIQRRMNNYHDAMLNCEEAMGIYKKMNFLPYVALTQQNLALIQLDLERFDESIKNGKEALKIYQKIQKEKSKKEWYLEGEAQIYDNIAIALQRTNLQESTKYYKKSIGIFQQLLQLAPQNIRYIEGLAHEWRNLAILNMNHERYKKSYDYCSQALPLHRQLYQQDPYKYKKELARTLHMMGCILSFLDIHSTDIYYEEALQYYKELKTQNPNKYSKVVEDLEDYFMGMRAAKDVWLPKI